MMMRTMVPPHVKAHNSYKPAPFGDVVELGKKPLFLETGGAVLGPKEQELCWSVLRFADERYEGATTRQAQIADSFGKYLFAEEGHFPSYFAGEWRDSRPCGFGIRQYANGNVFLGQFGSTSFGDTIPNGAGICTFSNGDILAGEWKDGIVHGRGMQQTTEDGTSAYVGHYLWGLRSGMGVYNFPDGSEYAGQFLEDAPHGVGSYKCGKDLYLGPWASGKRHGWSIFSTEEGSNMWAGNWDAGKLVWSQRLLGDAGSKQPGLAPDTALAVQQCWKVARAERASSDAALELADDFCDPDGPLQRELEEVRSRAQEAGEQAEAAARKARALKPLKWNPKYDGGMRKLKPNTVRYSISAIPEE